MRENFLRTLSATDGETEEHILLRSDNPITFTCLTFSPRYGFSGGIFMAMGQRELEDIADNLGSFPKIDEFPLALIDAAIKGSKDTRGYDGAQLAALLDMIGEQVPEKALRLVGPRPSLNTLSFFATGDKTARLQARIAFPVSSREFLKSPEMIEAIDQRKSVLPVVQAKHNLSNDALRNLARIEANLSACLKQDLESGVREPGGGIERCKSAEVISAARHVRLDQIPSDLEDIVEMANHMFIRESLSAKIDIGSTPFDRITRRATPDTWRESSWAIIHAIKGGPVDEPKGLSLLQTVYSTMVHQHRDYLASTSKAIASGVLVSMIRAQAPDELDQLARTADMIWEKKDPPAEEAQALKSFLTGFKKVVSGFPGSFEHSIREIRHIIGEHIGLKTLNEMQERWHHNRETIADHVSSANEEISWPALIGEVDLGRAIAREITSSIDLEAQGKREDHCVGGYTSRIMDVDTGKATLIFSLEKAGATGSGPALSTVEIEVSLRKIADSRTLAVNVVQNKARRNRDPGNVAHSLAQELRDILGEITPSQFLSYIGSMSTETQSLGKELQRIIVASEGNITCADLPERCLEAYERVLPKPLRGLGIDEWTAMLAARLSDHDVLKMRVDTLVSRMKEDRAELARPDQNETLPSPA